MNYRWQKNLSKLSVLFLMKIVRIREEKKKLSPSGEFQNSQKQTNYNRPGS